MVVSGKNKIILKTGGSLLFVLAWREALHRLNCRDFRDAAPVVNAGVATRHFQCGQGKS